MFPICDDVVTSSIEPNLVISFDGGVSRNPSPTSSPGTPAASKSGIEKLDGASEGVGRVTEGVAMSEDDA